MSELTGHAAFHLKHIARGPTGTRTDRRKLLQESARHLNAKDVARHATKNASIVPTDSHLNTLFVNDGLGGFNTATSVKVVLDYGDDRERRVRRKLTEGQWTLQAFVVHLPKTMCIEIKDYYPRRSPDGSERLDPVTGEQMSRSRWMARDRDEAMRYFRDAVAYLGEQVVPGGQAAIHGWATNFDETTPHIQLMADPFAPDPKAPDSNPGALRTEYNQAYGSHREVLAPDGKQIGPAVKYRNAQAGLREHMVAQGWPVEEDVSPGHGKELSKPEYEQVMDAVAEAKAAYDGVRVKTAANNTAVETFNAQAAEVRAEFDARVSALDERESILERREAELPALRRIAVADGKSEGHKEGYDDGRRAARKANDQAVKIYLEQLRMNAPKLLDEFLDRKDKQGRSLRPVFERYIDQRLERFEVEHNVAGQLELEPGDREIFIADGGAQLASEVAQLQREREIGE